jgi:hypothetical protein
MQYPEYWIKWVMAFQEIDAHEGTWGQDQDVSDFVEE